MFPRRMSDDRRVLMCPSILSADFAALGESIRLVAGEADLIHVDIMDGHYVPNLSFGPPIVAAIRQATDLPLDVHLMVEDPIRWIEPFARAGADSLVIHAEACIHLQRGLQQIADAGLAAGVALNPGSPLVLIEEVLPFTDLVLLMTVNPGFGGQSYVPGLEDKIRRLRQMIDQHQYPCWLQIDGGISAANIAANAAAGAELFVVGSSCFGAPDPVAALREMRRCAMS